MKINRGDIFYIDIKKDVLDPYKQFGYRPCKVISNNTSNKYCSRVQ